MEQLPIEINGKRVYAGFWKRFLASIVDMFVSTPFIIIFYYLENISFSLAFFIVVLSSVFFSGYTVYFHYKFGATLGKMASNIKVTLPNGEPIGLKQALLRSSVDIIFSFFTVIAVISAMSNANADLYLNSGWLERGNYLLPFYPVWYKTISTLRTLWSWSEFVVLLFNKRKRAIHDFIAGTVVIDAVHAKKN